MTFASGIRKTLDKVRGIGGKLGLRPFSVIVRVDRWDGGAPGRGGRIRSRTPLLVNGQPVKVAQVSNQDAVLSAGLYSNQDLRIGPMTPPFRFGGVEYATLDPTVSPEDGAVAEMLFEVYGPGLPAGGILFERIRDESDSALHLYVVVRSKGVSAS